MMSSAARGRKIVATVEARMKSSRLPGKVLKPILGRPMLELMIERVRSCKSIDSVIVATTDDPSCDRIEAVASSIGVQCYRGSENDVLDRVLRAATQAEADVIVELRGDCPLVDPGIIDRVVSTFLQSQADYCSNALEQTYPLGMDVEVFSRSVLEKVAELTTDPAGREHVSLYIYEHPEKFRLVNVASGLSPTAGSIRLTVDTADDFKLVSSIYESLYDQDRMFSLDDILSLLSRRPDLLELNRHVRQKKACPQK